MTVKRWNVGGIIQGKQKFLKNPLPWGIISHNSVQALHWNIGRSYAPLRTREVIHIPTAANTGHKRGVRTFNANHTFVVTGVRRRSRIVW